MTDTEERFQQHRRDEEQYWDAMNNKSWQTAGRIQQSMDQDIADGALRDQYQQWKKNEELRENALKNLEYDFAQQRDRILNK